MEIALFHSMKQDPFFKHYLYNHMRQFAEHSDDTMLNFASGGGFDDKVYDHVKFDRINVYDFRRQLPQQEREPIIDSKGHAWGYGKRKASKSVVRLKPGNGKITINGMPMLSYFHYPS